jgi:hypothetical protein
VLACQVLESFDNLGANEHEARASSLAKVFRPHPELLILKGRDMQGAFEAFGKISSVVPKKIIYDVLRAIRTASPGLTVISEGLAPYPGALGFFEAFKDALIPDGLGGNLRSAAAWFHLSQLWDYLVDPVDIGR